MKRVLLDHCVLRPFAVLLVGCTVSIAAGMGWAQLTNGELLEAAQVAARQIAIIELPTNRLRLIAAYAPQVNILLTTISPGAFDIVAP